MIHKLAKLMKTTLLVVLAAVFCFLAFVLLRNEFVQEEKVTFEKQNTPATFSPIHNVLPQDTIAGGRTPLHFKQEDHAYCSENVSQQYSVKCLSNGLMVTPMNNSGWSYWGIKNTDIQEGTMFLLEPHVVCYSRGGSVFEWYKHTEKGIEQGVTVTSKVSNLNDELKFTFQVASDLDGEQIDTQTILFVDSKRVKKLKYEKLVAFDANGKSLLSSLSWDKVSSQIHWKVSVKDAVYPVTIDPLITTFTKRIGEQNVPNGGLFFNFGESLALDGVQLAVGAQGEGVDNDSSRRGAAYVYSKNSGGLNNWGLIKKINAPDFSPGDNFGSAVGLSGEYLAVGARWADPSNVSNAGKVYLFRRDLNGVNNWGYFKTLTVSNPQQDDNYGRALLLKEDLLFVGMPQFANSSGDGKVFVYRKDQGGVNNWGLVKTLLPLSSESNAHFGASLALENNVLVVGKPGLSVSSKSSSGGVSIYRKDLGGLDNWGHEKAIIPSVAQSLQSFGSAVDIQGDELIVGASGYSKPINAFQNIDFVGAAYTFQKNAGGVNNWGQIQQLLSSDGIERDAFGSSVQLLGGYALVGAIRNRPMPDDSQIGSVYIHEKTGTGVNTWTFSSKLASGEGGSLAQYGSALVGDSFHLVSAARSADIDGITSRGAAYIYRLQNSQYEDWLSNNFASQELGQSNLEETLWGVSADPDGDSIINIEEAYFDTDPRASSSIDMYADYQNSKLSVSYSISSETNGVTAEPFWSKNLLQWYESGQGPESDLRNLDVSDLSGVRKIEMNPSSGANGFIQLQYIHD